MGSSAKRVSARSMASRVWVFPGNVEIQAVLRHEKGLDRPVTAIALVPDLPTVLQFDQRLQHGIAIAGRTQVLATDIW